MRSVHIDMDVMKMLGRLLAETVVVRVSFCFMMHVVLASFFASLRMLLVLRELFIC